MWPFSHKHKWRTTHTNRWLHPTVQVCHCGASRQFEWKANKDKVAGMPWEKGRWVDSDGKEYKYAVTD